MYLVDISMNTENTHSLFARIPLSPHTKVEDMETLPLSKVSQLNPQSSSFWTNRLIEAGLILSMALYYIIGNPNLPLSKELHSHIFSINPIYSLPFLLIFAVLCWFRLPFAVALLPLSLPYYLLQKNVYGHYNFSLVEITLATIVLVALLQIIVSIIRHEKWAYSLSWAELRSRIGPFLIPLVIFFLAAACSILIAYNRTFAFRAFREEVFDPFVYMLLALACLRSRQDVGRLLSALFASGLVIALLGLIQFVFFKHTLALEDGVRRVHAVYGSANSIGLLFDYTLPLGLALCLSQVSTKLRLLALVLLIPFLPVLYLTDSRGAWFAIALSAIFVVAFSIQNRRFRLIGGIALIALVLIASLFFGTKIINFLIQGHTSQDKGYTISTVTKRVYLWESALQMIHDSPWLGYGMDNWLCHYSNNTVCHTTTIYHYWILKDPKTGQPTGLADEPALSHPHNIFLHVWVSMGIFGLLALIAALVLFFWLFARILRRLHASSHIPIGERILSRAMTIGVGASMLAALIQGQIDSAFLEQDLAFCFWTLVVSLLLLRMVSFTLWSKSAKA